MRKTKIVATIGPVSMEYAMLKKLALAGMNVVRINLSHAQLPDMDKIMANIKKLRKELNKPLPVMIDTRGPEIRVKTFAAGQVKIKRGQKFVFTARDVVGDENIVSFNLPQIVNCIKVGQKILAVNGLLTFKVVEIVGKDVVTIAENSGVISNRKSLSLPNVSFSVPYLNEADKQDILWGIKNDVEFVAASFVNDPADLIELKKFIADNGGNMQIVAKIESQRGVNNLDKIIEQTDGLMVARGDLGVELPVERLPDIQKVMIKKALHSGKFVITATEMLESMITSSRPTRAEVSDVANAVYDGSSAVMLSGETAAGKHPVEAVKTMAKVCEETEKHIDYCKRFEKGFIKLNNTTDVISHSAVSASFLQKTKAIVVFTSTGTSAAMISRFRPATQIIGATFNPKVYRQLDIHWGVYPILTPVYSTVEKMFNLAHDFVVKNNMAKAGDKIVITSGQPKQNGCTNLIKVEEI